ncbi:hypothetical protein N7532_002482 [Penicillium argentinense]|uniref:Myb-like domain-containing protein n=1 Tax=Penicillium argentinense TaxID=1131581 RepID=A0A9W9G222_9EURO|nr:uncharacterized protein N7532_002482 [Penicillium argentinense]KAJ5109837.1 hypothetical protein N7532_002482 [Penicillium argentinense]
MKAFSSSVINKSGKKFAPKAPPRRGAPGAPARRPSATQQVQAQTAQAVQHEREAIGPVASPAISSAEPEQSAITESTPLVASSQEKTQPPATSKSATAIPIPRPKPRASATHKSTITPIPAPDISRSPRTSATEPQIESGIVPSIEEDAEPSTRRGAPPAPTHTSDATLNEQPSPRSSATQPVAAPPAPSFRTIEYQPNRPPVPDISKPRQRRRSHISIAATTVDGTEAPGVSVTPSTPDPSQAGAKGKRRQRSEADGAGKPKRPRRRKREPTPEDAETVEIVPNVVKMSDLCKDLKTGRKSKREVELRRLEVEELEHKLKAQEEGSNNATPKKSKEAEAEAARKEREQLLEPKGPAAGPVMRIVNGEIVLDATSLEVDRHADAARNAGELEDVVENQLTRKVNQSTYGKRSKTESWDDEMTDLFYRGLRMFGTDFGIISNLFPGRSRRQIKLKFNSEERKYPERIRDTLLGPREVIDADSYSALTNQTLDDPKIVQKELDEEKSAMEEQHAKEKQLQEEMMRNPNGAGAEEEPKNEKGKAKGKSRNSKKQAALNAAGGTEEVLGSIDEIPAF